MTLGWYSIEPSFFNTMKIDIAAGRALSKQRAKDSIFVNVDAEEAAIEAAARAIVARGLNVVVNESAAKLLGFRSASEAVGKQIGIPIFGRNLVGHPPSSWAPCATPASARSAIPSLR